jgi:hypothetical protein
MSLCENGLRGYQPSDKRGIRLVLRRKRPDGNTINRGTTTIASAATWTACHQIKNHEGDQDDVEKERYPSRPQQYAHIR